MTSKLFKDIIHYNNQLVALGLKRDPKGTLLSIVVTEVSLIRWCVCREIVDCMQDFLHMCEKCTKKYQHFVGWKKEGGNNASLLRGLVLFAP